MATSQGALATTTAVADAGSDTTSTTSGHSQTIVGSHVLRIDGFSATKDLGIGKSIKSSIFAVGGHSWYIECYPCGHVDDSAGWVSLYLRRQQDNDDHGSRVSGYCKFTLMVLPLKEDDGCFNKLRHPSKSVGHWLPVGIDFIKREELEWLLDDDCFQVRCVVFIHKLSAAPPTPPDLAAGESETMAWSHLLTIDDSYTKIRREFDIGEAIVSSEFHVGGHSWYFEFYPRGEDEDDDDDRIGVSLYVNDISSNYEVKIWFDITLLTHCGMIIASTQDFSTFTESNEYSENYLIMMEHESSPLLQDGIQIRCDIAIVDGITAMPKPHQSITGDRDLQASLQVRVRGDVTFKVGGQLFPAHKCVLTTRCTVFLLEFLLGQSGNKNSDQPVRINHMEPKVFEALLHFIYTDTLPEVSEEDKVRVAQGLLVAADWYAMGKLELICDDLLCSYINDPRTAVTTLNIADKLGCCRLKEVCMKFLMDHFA